MRSAFTAICSEILGAFSGAARRAIEPGPWGEDTTSGPWGPSTTTSLLSRVLAKARASPKLSREAGLNRTFRRSLEATHMCLYRQVETDKLASQESDRSVEQHRDDQAAVSFSILKQRDGKTVFVEHMMRQLRCTLWTKVLSGSEPLQLKEQM